MYHTNAYSSRDQALRRAVAVKLVGGRASPGAVTLVCIYIYIYIYIFFLDRTICHGATTAMLGPFSLDETYISLSICIYIYTHVCIMYKDI